MAQRGTGSGDRRSRTPTLPSALMRLHPRPTTARAVIDSTRSKRYKALQVRSKRSELDLQLSNSQLDSNSLPLDFGSVSVSCVMCDVLGWSSLAELEYFSVSDHRLCVAHGGAEIQHRAHEEMGFHASSVPESCCRGGVAAVSLVLSAPAASASTMYDTGKRFESALGCDQTGRGLVATHDNCVGYWCMYISSRYHLVVEVR